MVYVHGVRSSAAALVLSVAVLGLGASVGDVFEVRRVRVLLVPRTVVVFFVSIRLDMEFKCDWSLDVCSFYSSRRRHTRFKCDWSSDVCSSDLSRITTTLRSLTRTPTTLTTCTDVSSTVTESG